MSDQIKQQLREAYEYVKNGQRDQARAILDSIVKSDPDNADAWWLMAMAVSTPVEMRNALENVMRIKPDHANARQMLDKINAQLFSSTPAAPPPAPQPPSPVIPPAPTVSSAPPAASVSSAPLQSTGSQMGESIDDLFAPLPSGATGPAAPKTPVPENDLFAPLPSGTQAPVYTPPPYSPSATAKKGRNPIIYILLAVLIGSVCVCGACVAVAGLGGAAFLNDPTVQASFGTAGAIIGTGVNLVQAPDKLPAGAKKQGSLSANQSKTARLAALEQHTWQYQGKRGEAITITVKTSTNNFDPYIGLYDAEGSLVSRTDAGRTGSTKTLTETLRDDATYTILVGGLGGAPGNYTITVTSRSQQSQ